MSAFDKEQHDISLMFLAYLAFLGNTTKVAIAIGTQPEVVEVFAAKEDWPGKLKTYMGLRHECQLSRRDKAIRRTVNLIQGRHLQSIIQRLMDHIYKMADQDRLIDWMSPRDPRTNRPKLNVRILCDLIRAFHIAGRIVADETDIPTRVESTESVERERQTFYEAMRRAIEQLDRLPTIDSVALGKESLQVWKANPQSKDKS
jgi:hypothetical protein